MKVPRKFHLREMALVISAILFGQTAVAQQPLTVKKVGTNYTIEARAPVGDPHNLQASENLQRWINVQENIEDLYTYTLPEGVSKRYFRLTPSTNLPTVRIVLIGDSMVANCCGWGQGMPTYFNASARVINYAQPWTSSKSFLTSVEMDKLVLLQPEYVLMQFAYSECCDDPERTTTYEEFTANLRFLIDTIRGWNGTPILIGLHAGMVWSSQGQLIAGRHPRDAFTKQVADEKQTQMIDFYPLTFDLFSRLGQSGSAFMEYATGDPMHVSYGGALQFSWLIARELPDSLSPYLAKILDPAQRP